jgi:hypothetical protein
MGAPGALANPVSDRLFRRHLRAKAMMPDGHSDTRGGFRVYGVLGRIKLGPWQRVFLLPPPRGRS